MNDYAKILRTLEEYDTATIISHNIENYKRYFFYATNHKLESEALGEFRYTIKLKGDE